MVASESRERVEARVHRRIQLKRWLGMRRAVEMLGEIEDEDELLAAAARLLVDEFGMVDSVVAMIDAKAGVLRPRAAAGAAERSPEVKEFPLKKGFMKIVDVAITGEPVVIRDAVARADAEGWGQLAREAKLRNAMITPIRVGDTIHGVIAAGQAEVDIGEDDVVMMVTFGCQLALALSRLRADRDRQRRVEELEAANARQAKLLETVRELSTPVVPVHDGILVLPLVGTIDTDRGEQLMEVLLAAIGQARAEVVICDVTGVPVIDSAAADILLRAMRAGKMLGAKGILVGVSPTVAQTLVGLGVELEGIVTCSNLQAGIARAMTMRGRERPRRARTSGRSLGELR
ncbi:GAF domain-containing protein [Pseudenhygromyxa sp. WMMC2535]|uniref:STAS domain-containing protein n=1 Tax=Pseudenhygromyxa sp. WMMC2535 TaxID=2712867 RepID=UPI001552F961|nr:STAS domain-containing protein [Pseudenhygromyxa sp. WMMC2535]NVB37097.1 GAF domain-containing protein [Pseudenhygromyxa sp. WMMC2535]